MAIHVIDAAMEIVVQEVNNYLMGSSLVVPANLLTQAGALTQGLEGNIALSLVNIEEDRISRPKDIYRKLPNGTVEVIQPEVRLNLYLLFAAVPMPADSSNDGTNFLRSVGNLSQVVGFFQTKNFFNKENTPGLPANLNKMFFELYPMTFEQQNHLWGSIGAKYMPSIMYKSRIVKIQEEQMVSDGPPITSYNINGKDKNA